MERQVTTAAAAAAAVAVAVAVGAGPSRPMPVPDRGAPGGIYGTCQRWHVP